MERRSFNKVVRGIKSAEERDGGGSGGMTRNEMEKHFIDQQDCYESLERKMAHLQTLFEKMEKVMEKISTNGGQSEDGKLDTIEMMKSAIYNTEIKHERKT